MLTDLDKTWQKLLFWQSGETDTAGFSIRLQGAELLSVKDEKMGVLAFFGDFKVI